MRANRQQSTSPARRFACVAASLALCAALFPCSAFASEDPVAPQPETAGLSEDVDAAQPLETTDEIIVTYKDEPGFDVIEPEDGQDVEEAMEELAEDPAVATVEQNQVFHLLGKVNDPFATSSTSYHLSKQDFFGAWDSVRTDGAVTVAVLDTGVSMPLAYRLADLAPNVDYAHAWDATTGKPLSSDYVDTLKHGTEVASCISALADNGLGTAGVSYNAAILPINVFKDGETTTKQLLRAYDYVLSVAKALNVKVINMSLGGEDSRGMANPYGGSPSLQYKVNQAFNKGILTVAAAGNHETKAASDASSKCYPASLERVVSVAAIDKYSAHPWWSYHNKAVDVSAAGVDVPIANERYVLTKYNPLTNVVNYRHEVSYSASSVASGTSFAAPIVSGTAALLFAANPSLSVETAESILEGTAMDLGDAGKDQYFGYGAVNAAHAVRAALESPTASHALVRTTQEKSTYSKRGSYHYACPTCGYEFTLSSSIPKKAVTLSSVTAGKQKLTVKWKAASGVSGYDVQYRRSNSAYWTSVRVSKSKKSAKLTGLQAKKKYQVRVRAYTKSGSSTIYSSYSSTKSKTTK